MPWLICYDIEKDALRTKIATKLLEAGLERLQWSVFAGELDKPRLAKLQLWLTTEIARYPPAENSVIILNLPPSDLRGMTVIGEPRFNYDELINPPNTLFF